ncbi:hypothetical protein KIN20_023044 [Parelaphostrongylus tenuis]|uniref:Uncharacterized protein n=1 Tax=Parelaphostrongylus tenuis TaxID=148309 RepID=A0AAD5NBY5_PARTN|nr:hypothetical protein KIN20_023044 [Parelaphostrongylus tenuis]
MTAPTAPELPPSYEEASNDAPPSYERLFGEFRRVDSPKGLALFVKKAADFVLGTLAAAVVLAILNIVPIMMVIIGSINRDECDVNPKIPTWLIVTGTVSLIRSAINFFFRFKDQQKLPRPIIIRIIDGLLSIFVAIWFILGTIWVYWVYDHVSYDPRAGPDYCDQLTYVFTFVFITVTYALMFLSCLCFCCCCCCICFRKRDRQQQPPVVVIEP